MPLDNPLAAPFLANPARIELECLAAALMPPPPIDLNRWAEEYLSFGPESPFPGRYDRARIPPFARILEVLSPEHPARTVTLAKSAQLGGTFLAQIFVAAAMDLDPGGTIHVHPTEANATGYARTKWRPMIRDCRRLGEIFETRQSKEGGNSTLHQETKNGRGWYRLSGANSPASLSMYSARRLIEDDLAKWEDSEAGDPEVMAESRTKAYRDAKVFKIGTPLLKGSCRITRAFLAGTQEHWHVPCPHCVHRHPLEPENFIAHLGPEHPEKACFVCPECGGVIEEQHRAAIVAAGEWVAHNPVASEPSFYLWAAYAPFEPWERIARSYLAALGDPKSEQVWWNDTAGRAYELPGEAPEWETLKARGEAAGRPRGIVPAGVLLLTLTFDCQDDYVDGVLVGWGGNLNRWIVERLRVEGHISEPETREELNRLVEHGWPTAAGFRQRADLVGIDANAWTDEVHDWAKRWPRSRVIMLRGVAGNNQPNLALVRKERRQGKLVKYQGRFYNVGVSPIKGQLYKYLRVSEPGMRGYIDFPAGLDDDYYEQLTAEKRVMRIDRKGFAIYEWTKPRSARNEQLDVMVYAEALAAGKLGWRSRTPEQWAALAAERAAMGAHPDNQVAGRQLGLWSALAPPLSAAASPEPSAEADAPASIPPLPTGSERLPLPR